MRFQLRAKISQKDYVDKNMKAFHYQQEIKAPAGQTVVGEDRLEQLKKQIENLKKCMA